MSVLKRSEVPVMETWNLDDLFTSEQAFDAAIDEVKAMASEIEVTLKGKIVDVTSAIKAISSYENLYKKLIPISTYASLAHSVDQTSTDAQMRVAKFGQVASSIGAQLSFITSELLALDEAVLNDAAENEDYKNYIEKLVKQMKKPEFKKARTEVLVDTGLLNVV